MIFTPENEVPGCDDDLLAGAPTYRTAQKKPSGQQYRGRPFDHGPAGGVVETGGPGRYLSLPVLGHLLIAEVPVLPQLQGREQHHEPAKS
jgi:hypothetical protein